MYSESNTNLNLTKKPSIALQRWKILGNVSLDLIILGIIIIIILRIILD